MSLWGIIKSGDVVGAVKKVISLAEGEIATLENDFPALGQFIEQFASDFGKKVLADAEALAPQVIAGTLPIQTAAAQLVIQALPQAGAIASADATTIALNALRVQVTSVQTATVAS